MEKLNIDAIEKKMIEIVEDLTQDWGLDLDEGITGHTLLVANLEFASVDIIQLCVAIEEQYERKFGFQELLMHDGHYISDLSITQLAKFVTDKF